MSIAAVAVVSIGLLVPAADAASAPITSYKGLPSGWSGFRFPCTSTGSPTNYSPAHVTGPSTPPVGSGSLRVTESTSYANLVEIDFGTTLGLSSLTAFDGSIYVPSTSASNAQFVIGATDGSTTEYLLTLAPITRDSWVSLDMATATLNWEAFNNQTGTTIADGADTLSGFVSGHPGLVLQGLAFEPTNPCESSSFYLDNVHYAAGATDNTVDFEAPYADSFVNGSHPSSVLTGTALTLSATLSSGAHPFTTSQSVQLWAKGSSSTTYKLIKTLTTDPSTGVVSYRVAPSSTTSYQWRYPATGTNYAPVNASAFSVTTRQRVVVTSKPTMVRYGAKAYVSGYVRPIKGGVKVRLIRLVSGKRIVVATVSTGPKGVFNIYAPMTVRGTYTYLVSALPYPGEALGQSATFKIATK